MGDCVKGCSYDYYPERVAAGILMHRAIDTFTDSHEVSAQCRTLLRPVAGKFAGVALDLLYYHVLARNWSLFSTKALDVFADDVYRRINQRFNELTMENRIMMGYMERENWLLRYATTEGMQRSLSGMSKRISYDNNLDEVMPLYETIKGEFDPLALTFLHDIVAKLHHEHMS